ncbi:RHS repeat-associated core domain-containing protein [Cellulomonas telluris]|uniref:RHS repeat-associated core domain-containing protein n=1 Tax=Cellulomonas telluris TaxID=2306636 RepID=UPI001CA3CDAA|nr:RHS repeat-associated core domain-containing protein [Cellulomonas telluris]
MFDAAGGFTGGYSCSPYGELRAASDNPVIRDNPLRFSSGLWDAAANLYRLWARYYDPSLGRFTQYDPTGQEPNPYSYAAGNPANFVDPTGTKMRWGWFTKAVDEVGKGLDGFQAFQTVRAHARGDTYNGSVGVASLAIGGVVGGVCAGIPAGATGGAGLAAAGGCLALGAGASYGFEQLAQRHR